MRCPPLALLLVTLCGLRSFGDVDQAVQRAFREGPDIPWYDAQGDSLQQVPVRPRADPPSPSDWVQKPKPQRQPTNSNWNWNAGWDGFWTVVQWLAYALLAALAIFAIWMLWRELADKTLRQKQLATTATPSKDNVADVERLENLPVDIADRELDLLNAARSRYEQGNYGEAIVFLFSYQLIELDKHHLVQLVRGKTNGQYLRELSDRQALKRLVGETVHVFEDFFFGKHRIDADRFEACWSQLGEFQELIGVRPTA